jgi:hypothetical protein
MLPKGVDMSSQAIFDSFEKQSTYEHSPKFGDLVFYGQSVTKITHIAFALDQYRVIEAAGGGRDTVNEDVAAVKDAFVKISMVDSRRDRVAVLRPRYAPIGGI